MDWNLTFNHTLKKGNSYANWLAKNGAHSDTSFQIWNNSPIAIGPCLLGDALGMSVTRLH